MVNGRVGLVDGRVWIRSGTVKCSGGGSGGGAVVEVDGI